MTFPPPPANQKGMVRVLVVAIALMTTAIVVIVALMIAKILGPSEAEPARADVAAGEAQVIDFSDAVDVEIVLPAGVKLLRSDVSDGRIVLEVETADGALALLTAPLAPRDRPVRAVYREAD